VQGMSKKRACHGEEQVAKIVAGGENEEEQGGGIPRGLDKKKRKDMGGDQILSKVTKGETPEPEKVFR